MEGPYWCCFHSICNTLFSKKQAPGINSTLSARLTPYFSAITTVLPAVTRQLIPASRQIVRTTRQVITIHPAGSWDQPGGKFNHLLFYTRRSPFFHTLSSGMHQKRFHIELTKCTCFLHSGNSTENDLPGYPQAPSKLLPFFPPSFFSVISQLRETSINNNIPRSVWK